MMAQELWIIGCVIVYFVTSCTAAESFQLKKQLIGFRMCQHLCLQMSGCHVLTYIHRTLTCQIGYDYESIQTSEHRMNVFNITQTNRLTMTGVKKCPVGSILIRSRAKLYHCVTYRRHKKSHVQKYSSRIGTDDSKLKADTYEVCKNLHQLCDEGRVNDVKDHLRKLCAKSGSVGRMFCPAQDIYTLKNRCDLSQVNRVNDTILHIASKAGLLSVVKCILSKRSISVERRNINGSTPAMCAARAAQAGAFRLLFQSGSDLTKTDVMGYTLLHLAVQGGSVQIVKDILKAGSVSVNKRSKAGYTPIMTAVHFARLEIFKLLLNKGSDITKVTNGYGCNVLHIASSLARLKIVKYIVQRKIIDIDSKNNIGRTPIMLAVLHGRKRVTRCLMNHGADLRVLDANGNNLFHMAYKRGSTDIAKILMEYLDQGALLKRNKEGKLPKQLLLEKRH